MSAARERVTRRKNTSKACQECRRRRAKCDGVKPSCTRCHERVINCHYDQEEDGRQPAPKSYVLILRNRISLLERVLEMHDINVDASIAELATGEKGSRSKNSQGETQATGDGIERSSTLDSLCEEFDGALSLDESLNFDQDGEARYFGLTSGRLEFLSARLRDACVEDSHDNVAREDISRLGHPRTAYAHTARAIIDGDQVFEELESHLTDLYFIWEQPWNQVVNENLFRESQRSSGRYSTPLLLNCILCIGARFSDRVELRSDPQDSNTAGRVFLERAEVLLQHDLKRPSITTIQSLSLLSIIHIAMGSDAAGWLHQGMANRLVLDMGLNLDSGLLAGSSSIPPEEVELRRQIYWALYCHDKLSASYTGRVCTMLSSQGAVEMPSLPETGSSEGAAQSSKRKVVLLHNALIKLCRILEKILLALYAPKPLVHSSQRTAFLTACILELKNWLYDLPAEMRIDRQPEARKIAQAYTLHMVFHTTSILLVKPFLKGLHDMEGMSAVPPPRPANTTSTNDVCTIYYRAAREVCSIGRKYHNIFGSFRQSPITATHCTLSAALALLQSDERKTDSANVEVCLQVLGELSVSWDPAGRIRTNLLKLHQERGMPPAATVMDHTSVEFTAISTQPVIFSSALLQGPNEEDGMSHHDFATFTEPQIPDWNHTDFDNLFAHDNGGWSSGDRNIMLDQPSGNDNNLAGGLLPQDYSHFDALNRMHFDSAWE